MENSFQNYHFHFLQVSEQTEMDRICPVPSCAEQTITAEQMEKISKRYLCNEKYLGFDLVTWI